jgi:two-component system, sensor histidine kinase and response regulator
MLHDAIEAAMWKNISVEDTRIKSALNQVLDRAAVLDRMGGNTELIKGVVKIFNEDSPAQLFQIGKAIESGDEKSLLALAHTLKGSLLALAATEAAKTAEALENMGRTGDLTGAHDLSLRLEAEIANVSAALQDLVNSLA